MRDETLLKQALENTKIVRPPRHSLATFGTTILHYVLISEVPEYPGGCRLREGDVTAQRPQIVTPEMWQKRFEGFGEDQDVYRDQLERFYGEALRGLEYTFRNELHTSS